MTLTWGTATDNVGVVGYRLYNDDTEQLVVDIPTTSITLNALAPATYNYYVQAYDAAGNVSGRTGTTTVVISGAVPDTIRPSTPTKPVASNLGPDSVTLTWGTATDNVGVVGYRLYNDDTEQLVVDVPTTSTNLAGLAPGTYNYYVRAYDAAGNVGYRTGSTTVVITGAVPDTIRPSNPAGLMVTGLAPGTVNLSWTAATDNVGVVQYRIYDGVTNAQVLSVTGTTGSVTGLAPGSRSFYVRAVDAAGNVSYRSNIVTAVVP